MYKSIRTVLALLVTVASAATLASSGVQQDASTIGRVTQAALFVSALLPTALFLSMVILPRVGAAILLTMFSEHSLLTWSEKNLFFCPWELRSALFNEISDRAARRAFTGDSDVSILGDTYRGHGDADEGDFINEGDSIEGDDQDGDYIEGDDERILSAGDMFTGDVRRSPLGKFLISGTKKAKRRLLSPAMAAKVKAIAAAPGQFLSGKDVSPLMVNNCVINIAPTRAMVPGQALVETVTRAESMYNGRTRTQTFVVAAGGTQVVTFAAPAAGEVSLVPLIFTMISVKVLSAIANAEVRLSLAAVDESGAAVSALTWSVMLPKNGNAALITMVPFSEISTTVYARIVKADAVDNLVLTVQGLPADSYIRVFLPGADSTQYQYFKEGLGITKLPTKLARYLRQS